MRETIRVLITGSSGFIGRNLALHISQDDRFELVQWHRESSQALEDLVDSADAIVHLAGANRVDNNSEFDDSNRVLTSRLVDAVNASARPKRVFFSSSIQAENDSAYGTSKSDAEREISRIHAPSSAYISRLPNVFGKWAKPFYNSAVATFCYQAANGHQLSVHNPDSLVRLVYVDDVCSLITQCLLGEIDPGQVTVTSEHQTTVGWLAKTISRFAKDREIGVLPDLSDPLVRALFSTFHSALSVESGIQSREVNRDNRGWLFELFKSEQAGQIFVSSTRPGHLRGQHWHHSKVEKFCVIQGTGRLKFRRKGSEVVEVIDVTAEAPQVVDIPPGAVHSIENIGDLDMLLLVWASEIFDINQPDTWSEQVELN